MLTLFSTPKAFQGHFGVIQTNAIRSWAQIEPQPEIILCGNEEGTAKIAKDIGARHIAHIERNQYGTPLVNSIFGRAQVAASNNLLCYINADIILMSDFIPTVQTVCEMLPGEHFLLIGRKICSVDITDYLDFRQADWALKLKRRAVAEGRYGTTDSDYFVFRKGLWPNMPPFAIGRFYWSAWLVYDARVRGVKVIDATAVITAVEPRHDYSHVTSAIAGDFRRSAEVKSNARLFRGCKYWTTPNSSHVLTASGLKPSPLTRRVYGLFTSLDHGLGLAFHADPALRRYLVPVHVAYRVLKPLLLGLRSHILRRGLLVT